MAYFDYKRRATSQVNIGGVPLGADNPIISWCFGNAVLEEDHMENVKPVKNPGAPNAKVDVCQCICSCYIMIGNWGK